MRCPFCGWMETSVVDSRLAKDGDAIRRRRECRECSQRFTTYERVEEFTPAVVKKDGRREPFSRQKIYAGLERACQKRSVSVDTLEAFIRRLERALQERQEREIPSQTIGREVMEFLRDLDPVAYIRFASVYRSFDDISEFMSELRELGAEKGSG